MKDGILEAMPSLLLVVFVLQLVIHLVNTVGAGIVNNLVCFDKPFYRVSFQSLDNLYLHRPVLVC